MSKQFFCGAFNAEQCYKEEIFASLPSFKDDSSEKIVLYSDEILFPLVENDGWFVTRAPINEMYREYLNTLGFVFKNYSSHDFDDIRCLDIYELLLNDQKFKHSIVSGEDNLYFDTFSIINGAKEMCKEYGIFYDYPDFNIVKKVNSKIFSSRINSLMGISDYSKIIQSSDDFDKFSKLYNQDYLIKDPFGVSGKGIIRINNNSVRNSICSFLRKQEANGKIVSFILEPFFNKLIDFSCQIYISKEGTIEILSVNEMNNDGFSFSGIRAPSEELLKIIDSSNYLKTIELVGKQINLEGYYGYACIDSMVLKDERIIPVVEINARKSMSNVKNALDRRLSINSKKSMLSYYNFKNTNLSIGTLLEALKSKGTLFNFDRGGILPLSSSSITINKESDAKPYKARLFVYYAYNTQNEFDKYVGILTEILNSAI